MDSEMHNGLNPETIKAIRGVFSGYNEIESAWLYGSRAKGNYRPGSDIDITLTGSGLNLTILQKIETDLDDLMLPYKIDLSIKSQIQNEDLLDHISRVGIIFYSRK